MCCSTSARCPTTTTRSSARCCAGRGYTLDEGGERRWSKEVTALEGRDGRVARVHGRSVTGTSSRDLRPVPGSEFVDDADLVLIAIGFAHPEHDGLVEQLGVDLDKRGNVKAGAYATSVEGLFAAGDARMGQSLIVWAIAEGRKCARVVDRYLIGLRAVEPLEHEEALEPRTGELEMPSDAAYQPPNGAGQDGPVR
jgi:glutamate synthase (NADPH/NADH) small chain